jgi:hypothetical protein
MDCQSQIKEGSSWPGQPSSKGSYRLTLPIFGGSSKLFTTAKSFLGWLAAGDVSVFFGDLKKKIIPDNFDVNILYVILVPKMA